MRQSRKQQIVQLAIISSFLTGVPFILQLQAFRKDAKHNVLKHSSRDEKKITVILQIGISVVMLMLFHFLLLSYCPNVFVQAEINGITSNCHGDLLTKTLLHSATSGQRHHRVPLRERD